MGLDQATPLLPCSDHNSMVITGGEKRKTFIEKFRIAVSVNG